MKKIKKYLLLLLVMFAFVGSVKDTFHPPMMSTSSESYPSPGTIEDDDLFIY